MTARLEAARNAMAHAIAIYVPTHIYAEACSILTAAAVELEHAALEVVPAELPGELLPLDHAERIAARLPLPEVVGAGASPPIPNASPLDGPPPVIPNATGEAPVVPLATIIADAAASTADLEARGVLPPLPTTSEAVADALAPYEAPPVPGVESNKSPKSRHKAK